MCVWVPISSFKKANHPDASNPLSLRKWDRDSKNSASTEEGIYETIGDNHYDIVTEISSHYSRSAAAQTNPHGNGLASSIDTPEVDWAVSPEYSYGMQTHVGTSVVEFQTNLPPEYGVLGTGDSPIDTSSNIAYASVPAKRSRFENTLDQPQSNPAYASTLSQNIPKLNNPHSSQAAQCVPDSGQLVKREDSVEGGDDTAVGERNGEESSDCKEVDESAIYHERNGGYQVLLQENVGSDRSEYTAITHPAAD